MHELYLTIAYLCRMKLGFVLTMVTVLFALSFRDAYVCVQFYWNQPELAEKYCVNKDRPELQCDGKCYLKKTLEEQYTPEAPLPNAPDKDPLPFYGLLTNIEPVWSRLSFGFPICVSIATPFSATYRAILAHEVPVPPPKRIVCFA